MTVDGSLPCDRVVEADCVVTVAPETASTCLPVRKPGAQNACLLRDPRIGSVHCRGGVVQANGVVLFARANGSTRRERTPPSRRARRGNKARVDLPVADSQRRDKSVGPQGNDNCRRGKNKSGRERAKWFQPGIFPCGGRSHRRKAPPAGWRFASLSGETDRAAYLRAANLIAGDQE